MTGITAALEAGVPLRDVQEAASHADPRTAMHDDRACPGAHVIGFVRLSVCSTPAPHPMISCGVGRRLVSWLTVAAGRGQLIVL